MRFNPAMIKASSDVKRETDVFFPPILGRFSIGQTDRLVYAQSIQATLEEAEQMWTHLEKTAGKEIVEPMRWKKWRMFCDKETEKVREAVREWSKYAHISSQEILFNLVRSCCVKTLSPKCGSYDSLLQQQVEAPYRISNLKYGACSDDKSVIGRACFLGSLLFSSIKEEEKVSAVYFVSSLVERMVVENPDEKKDQATHDIAKVLIDHMMKLPDSYKGKMLSCFSLASWPQNMVSYLEEKYKIPSVRCVISSFQRHPYENNCYKDITH